MGLYKDKMVEDVSTLIDRLEYLKTFLEEKVTDENELKVIDSMCVAYTDIQLLSSKLKYK